MEFSRRRFLGAVAIGAAGLAAPRPFATVRAAETPDLLPRAMAALDTHRSAIANRDVIGLVDFSAASKVPRLHIVDIANGRVVDSMLVAHGRGSDPAHLGWVQRLSNQPGSNASCQGAFLTGQTYAGQHGRSRRLEGLDPQNNLALPRGIVIHQASYVSDSLALSQGRIGRSQGCFAVSPGELDGLLSRLGPGHLLYAWK